MQEVNGIQKNIDAILNEETFNDLFDKYWNSVYQVCIKYTGSEEDAEELAQDIFISVWNRREDIDIKNISSYLHGAAKLKSFNFLRNKNRRKLELIINEENLSDHLHPEKAMEFKELNLHFSKYCEMLPEPRKQIFLLSRQHDLNHKQISQKMNISLAMVEYHIGSALKSIRKKLKTFI